MFLTSLDVPRSMHIQATLGKPFLSVLLEPTFQDFMFSFPEMDENFRFTLFSPRRQLSTTWCLARFRTFIILTFLHNVLPVSTCLSALPPARQVFSKMGTATFSDMETGLQQLTAHTGDRVASAVSFLAQSTRQMCRWQHSGKGRGGGHV
ncbi:hypothetical protein K474DRAFT_1731016 [Panus rudis PR-1116 ss-1]|nr:hypothetical protein K474DRAFT_1731016 [Panus rudis PR-1116 ss-1]